MAKHLSTSHPHPKADGRAPARAGADRRSQILRSINTYWQEYGRPPTIREIGAAVGIKAPSVVAYHVGILERDGLLRREPGTSRGLLPTRPTGPRVWGAIAAGEPLDLFDPGELETLAVVSLTGTHGGAPTGLAGEMAEVYALRVRGTSMIEDGILDGDFVLIAPSPQVTNGAIAVVIHQTANGGRGAATLKRIFVDRPRGVRLQPANAMLTTRWVAAAEWDREWSVQGRVVGVYRDYAPRPTPGR